MISSEKWAENVRKFHNWWKIALITSACIGAFAGLLARFLGPYCWVLQPIWGIVFTQLTVSAFTRRCPLSELENGLREGIPLARIKRLFFNMFICTLIGILVSLLMVYGMVSLHLRIAPV